MLGLDNDLEGARLGSRPERIVGVQDFLKPEVV